MTPTFTGVNPSGIPYKKMHRFDGVGTIQSVVYAMRDSCEQCKQPSWFWPDEETRVCAKCQFKNPPRKKFRYKK
jgi:hypothetical protein